VENQAIPRTARALVCWYATKIFLLHAASVFVFTTMVYYGLCTVFQLKLGNSILVWGLMYLMSEVLALLTVRRPSQSHGIVKSVDHPGFEHVDELLRELCERRRVPKPEVYIAFAPIPGTRGWAFLADLLLRGSEIIVEQFLALTASREQLKAILAHELRHVGGLHRFATATKVYANIIFKVWFLGLLLSCLVLGFFEDRLWAMFGLAFAGVVILIGSRELIAALVGSMSRANEHLTDILSCLDTQNPQGLVDALGLLQQEEERKSALFGRYAAEVDREGSRSRSTKATRSPLWMIAYALFIAIVPLLFAHMLLCRVCRPFGRSHPNPAERKKVLEQVFGPLKQPVILPSAPRTVLLIEFDLER
jgi:Zn-dependent protease with chaperone function